MLRRQEIAIIFACNGVQLIHANGIIFQDVNFEDLPGEGQEYLVKLGIGIPNIPRNMDLGNEFCISSVLYIPKFSDPFTRKRLHARLLHSKHQNDEL